MIDIHKVLIKKKVDKCEMFQNLMVKCTSHKYFVSAKLHIFNLIWPGADSTPLAYSFL